jgi:hypothetical protein
MDPDSKVAELSGGFETPTNSIWTVSPEFTTVGSVSIAWETPDVDFNLAKPTSPPFTLTSALTALPPLVVANAGADELPLVIVVPGKLTLTVPGVLPTPTPLVALKDTT